MAPMSMDHRNAALDHMLNTGEWWTNPWWLEPQYAKLLDRQLVIENIEALKSVLDVTWTKEMLDSGTHSAISYAIMGMEGSSPFKLLMALGRIFRSLHGADGLEPKIADLLGDKNASVLFELRVSSVFAQQGFRVPFPRETRHHKTPDIAAYKDQFSYFIECKHLRTQDWERWLQGLMTRLSFSKIHRLRGTNLVAEIKLDQELSFLHSHSNVDAMGAITNGIVISIEELLDNLKASKSFPACGEVPQIATIRIQPDSPEFHGAVEGPMITSTANMRRILSNGILDAIRQLPHDRCGAIAVYCDFLPPPPLIKLVVDNVIDGMADFSNVAAIILFPVETIDDDFSEMLYLNHSYASEDGHVKELESIFRESIEPIVVN